MSELLKINVNEHTEKKNGLTYLSWAWAWAEVLKIDPGARWHAVEYSDERGCALPAMFLPDGSAMVKTEVTIKKETKVCTLPVMDHRNKAIKNPDAFAINTAIMRCMTKAISMHGLGLYIYAGEDLPEGEEPEKKPDPKKDEMGTQDALSLFAPAVQAKIRRVAAAAIEAFNEGKEYTAFEEASGLWNQYPEGDERNQIKLALAHIFKPHSALRASLKAHGEQERTNHKEPA